MKTFAHLTTGLSLSTLALASCAQAESGESSIAASGSELAVTQMGEFEKPWAIEFMPGTAMLAITEKEGALSLMNTATGDVVSIGGVPEVAFGGQGGFGDIAFLASEADNDGPRTIYLSWAEFGEDGETRGAVVGRGSLACDSGNTACNIEGLDIIWRQAPKVEGRGHYSHRISFSPDEQYMFIASGDRQKLTPAQDLSNTLGSIVRLNLDGTPAQDNPFADQGGVTAEIWSYGHRNILGMDWDADGRLWDIEHGPAGGDELNLVERAANYGWPTRSYGNHYNGDPIDDHTADDGFNKPAAHWTPVIAPGDMIFYTGSMFADWKGDALIAGLSSNAVVRVELGSDGSATEAQRVAIEGRVRSIDEAPDGAIWLATDEGKILKVSM